MIRTRYWLLTFLFAAAAHAGVLGLVMQDEAMTESNPFVGQQVSINLVLASAPPKPVPQPVVEQPVEPEPVVEKPVVEKPVIEEPVVEEVTDEPAEVVAKKPVEKPEPKPVKKAVEKPPVEKKPEPKPELKPAVVETPPEPTPVEKPPVETQAIAEAETSETSDAYRKGNSDTQQVSVKGGAQASAEMAYISHLKRELAKHKRYPKKALFRRHEGTTSVWLRLSSDGKLVDYEIVESSGHNTLDKEVVKMLKRVGDLPPFPADMKRTHLDIQVPISFNLRG